MQDANSPIMEELIFLHDFINIILIFIISFLVYVVVIMVLNKYTKNHKKIKKYLIILWMPYEFLFLFWPSDYYQG